MKDFFGEKDMILRLEDIVRGYDFKLIKYKIFLPQGGDLTVGECKYENGELISLDGDIYSLKDPILKYEIHKDGTLTVWEDYSNER